MTLAGIVVIMMLSIFLGARSREFRLRQMVIILILTLIQVCYVSYALYNEDKIPELGQPTEVGAP